MRSLEYPFSPVVSEPAAAFATPGFVVAVGYCSMGIARSAAVAFLAVVAAAVPRPVVALASASASAVAAAVAVEP